MYWIELHIHTEEGSLDSILDLKELLKEYKRIGVDGVCITEHIEWKKISLKEYEGLYSAFDHREENNIGVDIFPGAEIKLENGYEYLVYGIKIPYEWFGMEWDKAINKINKSGGIVIKSHPYREENEVIVFDGIEVYNFCSNLNMNRKACRFAEKEEGIIKIIGCDAHSIDVVGMAIMVLEEKPKNGVELARLLKEKQVKGYIIKGREYSEEKLYENIFDSTNDCRF